MLFRSFISLIALLAASLIVLIVFCGLKLLVTPLFILPDHIKIARSRPKNPPPRPSTPPPVGRISYWGTAFGSACDQTREAILWEECQKIAIRCGEQTRRYEEERRNDERMFRNISYHCFRAADCMTKMYCRSGDEMYERFYRIPNGFFQKHGELPRCIVRFYRAIRQDSFGNCTGQFDFLSKNATIKYQAYVQGRQCLVDFAEKNCQKLTFQYLRRNYSNFLELSMTPSGSCGLYQKYEALECQDFADSFKKSANEPIDYGKVAEKCESMQSCIANLTDDCAISKTFTRTTQEYCEKMRFLSTPFMQCLESIKANRYRPNLVKHHCFVGHDFNDDASACARFGRADVVNCVKRIMVDFCGSKVENGYDEARRYLLESWDCHEKSRIPIGESFHKLYMDLRHELTYNKLAA
ncbi:unnamed protein product [Caenorhabditis sp. 36 PRJEB53466]|nr:unnamed protein product [Caenorhabditis sp. 36 PRJEB53466]